MQNQCQRGFIFRLLTLLSGHAAYDDQTSHYSIYKYSSTRSYAGVGN